MALIGERDGPAELGHGAEVHRRITRSGGMREGIAGQEPLGELLGIGPAIAIPIDRAGRKDEGEQEQRAHAGHPAPPRRVRKRGHASGEWASAAGGV